MGYNGGAAGKIRVKICNQSRRNVRDISIKTATNDSKKIRLATEEDQINRAELISKKKVYREKIYGMSYG